MPSLSHAEDVAKLVEDLAKLDTTVLPTDDASRKAQRESLPDYLRDELRAANRRSTAEWRALSTREQWETFRDKKITALRETISRFPAAPAETPVAVTKTLPGEGFQIQNLVFQSRPHLIVTANLYVPDPLPDAATCPGMLIIPSHHNPKTQSELQDMGMTWARAGCYVIVCDQLGHGERRQHPFNSSSDYGKEFRVGRQDYYFRYNLGMQLHLIGDSLIGWMAWDYMRAIDVLFAQPKIDPNRIIVLGAVASGGDPCGVLAALDARIKAAVPFNFGGPQPETRFPLPEDVEESFNYAGSGSWESTRNISFSARDGFLPWVIVSSIAPRPLIHAHEFKWDRDRDPVWKRYEHIWGDWYNERERLSFALGYGAVTLSSSEASHCNNIGPTQREYLHPAFEKWFNIPQPKQEYRNRRESGDLMCLTSETGKRFDPRPVREIAKRLADERSNELRERWTKLDQSGRRTALAAKWRELLGLPDKVSGERDLQAEAAQSIKLSADTSAKHQSITVDGLRIPMLVLVPKAPRGTRIPAVIMLAQGGKQRLLAANREAVATLLSSGVAVCLPDLRGMGETDPDSDRSQWGWHTSLSSTALMLGRPMVGQRLSDLHHVIRSLQSAMPDGSAVGPIGLWGDSLARVNGADVDMKVPLRVEQPEQSEPIGGLLALLGALTEDDVKAIFVRGGLVSYGSVLESPFTQIPHDIVVPGAIAAGDLSDIAAALAPTPLRMQALVTGENKLASAKAINETYAAARRQYELAGHADRLTLDTDSDSDADIARWIAKQLKAK